MSPHTLVSLFILIGCAAACFALAFFLPRSARKLAHGIICLLFAGGVVFFAARPFIIEYQTEKAASALENHLNKHYPENRWDITDTDSDQIQAAIRLHVRFEDEPNMIYEYVIRKKHVQQINRWTTSGHSPEESGIQPEHTEF